MGTVPMVTKTGPRTYTPAELVLGGQVVEGRAAGRIGVAGAASTRVLGIAVKDGINPEALTGEAVVVQGRPVLNAALLPSDVPVAYSGIEVPATYAAAANFGDKLISAATGQVTPAGAAPDARTIVGTCASPDGVAADAVGLVRTV